MPRNQDAIDKLEEAIVRLAEYVDPEQTGGQEALKVAAAANQLAEARAWLHSSTQPHGGSSISS